MPTKDRLQLIFLFHKVLRPDKWLSRYRWDTDWLSSAQRRQIVYLKGTVGETGIFHYCFPSVKSDLFSYLVLATETNHALIYFPFFFLVPLPFGKHALNDLFSFRLAQLH